ncbi:HK97 family phage prohead protease [Achromobacter sp. UBA4530]|uniref:HK97 family phage prohead protease n=1 Tax=Achromobacter sp. UBA4530 TaxID=1945912 RepID=UPI0025808280|nr:HK97 family phage prohead protease [Achromobacter sp. UBA4530]
MNRKSAAIKHRQMAFKTTDVNEDGSFTGYGSVFGTVDSYREIVAPGAFLDSLQAIKASGDPLPALWQHRSDSPIGGYDLLEEDERGLKVGGWLMHDVIPLAREALALMKRRVVKGLSIGYYVEESNFNEKTGIRTLTKLDLQEISIVTFPANPDAQVDAVKRKLAEGSLPTIREFEEILREKGFSRSQAERISVTGYKSLLDPGEPGRLAFDTDPVRAALNILRDTL